MTEVKDSIQFKEQAIVLSQLFATNPNLRLSIGGTGEPVTFTRDEIINHVKNMDEYGKDYIKTQMEFMRSFNNNKIYDMLNAIDGL
jgi:hypothetical protein